MKTFKSFLILFSILGLLVDLPLKQAFAEPLQIDQDYFIAKNLNLNEKTKIVENIKTFLKELNDDSSKNNDFILNIVKTKEVAPTKNQFLRNIADFKVRLVPFIKKYQKKKAPIIKEYIFGKEGLKIISEIDQFRITLTLTKINLDEGNAILEINIQNLSFNSDSRISSNLIKKFFNLLIAESYAETYTDFYSFLNHSEQNTKNPNMSSTFSTKSGINFANFAGGSIFINWLAASFYTMPEILAGSIPAIAAIGGIGVGAVAIAAVTTSLYLGYKGYQRYKNKEKFAEEAVTVYSKLNGFCKDEKDIFLRWMNKINTFDTNPSETKKPNKKYKPAGIIFLALASQKNKFQSVGDIRTKSYLGFQEKLDYEVSTLSESLGTSNSREILDFIANKSIFEGEGIEQCVKSLSIRAGLEYDKNTSFGVKLLDKATNFIGSTVDFFRGLFSSNKTPEEKSKSTRLDRIRASCKSDYKEYKKCYQSLEEILRNPVNYLRNFENNELSNYSGRVNALPFKERYDNSATAAF